jgi:ribonucleotide monophosphatase NagD (HAD superfamily)
VTGCKIHLVGKPSLDALRCAGRTLDMPLSELAVVGDDPLLEVPMAHSGRSLAIAVTSGLGGADAFAELRKERWPHITVGGVDELLELCRRVK